MKRSIYLWISALVLTIAGLSSCSSDDETTTGIWCNSIPINSLVIQSDKGEISWGGFYKSGEMYNPPHCYLGSEITFQGDRIYHMGFGANIKGSDVFDMLNINFESSQPMSFSNLKAGDTFDSSQFHAAAAYTPTWPEAILRQTTALSGKVTVVGTNKVGDKSYMSLKLSDLRFDAIDRSCVYSINGTVEYEIWDIQYE